MISAANEPSRGEDVGKGRRWWACSSKRQPATVRVKRIRGISPRLAVVERGVLRRIYVAEDRCVGLTLEASVLRCLEFGEAPVTPQWVATPPPAFAATSQGEWPMAYGSYRWRWNLNDIGQDLFPAAELLPPLRVLPGEVVQFRFGQPVEPTAVTIRIDFIGPSGLVAESWSEEAEELSTVSPSWRVWDRFPAAAETLLVLAVRSSRGSATYYGRLALGPLPAPPSGAITPE